MRRFIIEVPDAAASRMEKGLRCKASVFMRNGRKGILTMKAYKHQTGAHPKGELIRTLSYGWVKATPENYIIRGCLPRTMGPVDMLHAINQDVIEAKNAIIDNEIVDRV